MYYANKMTKRQSANLIKILYIITQGEMGGAQRYVYDLATGLDPKQYKVTVAVGNERGDLEKKLSAAGISTRVLRHLKRAINPWHDLLVLWEIRRLIQAVKPDIVHLNSTKAGFVGSIAAAMAGARNVVFTAHGFAFLEPGSALKKMFYLGAEKLVRGYRAKIIAVSQNDHEAALKNSVITPEKLATIHNGIGEIDFLSRDEARRVLNQYGEEKIAPDDIVIGTIAHNYKTKGLPNLRAAFSLVQKDFPKVKLCVIGKGGTVSISDPDGDRARRLLPAFDVYVSSSLKEGFPYTILEAMTAGLPIAATGVGGIPEAITSDREGLLVPPNDSGALAGAIKQILRDAVFAKTLGDSARERVKQFSLSQMISKTESVYRELLGQSA